jgi:tetratricopeptide (TPR) repeat protein
VRDIANAEPAKGDDPVDIAWAQLGQALVAQRADDPSAVALARDAAERLVEASGLWDDLVVTWPVAMELALRHDDEPTVRSLLDTVDEAKGLVPLGLVAHRHRASAVLARRAGRIDEAVTELRSAVRDFEAWGARAYLARAQAELSQCLRLLGRHDEAASMSERAREALRALRAEGWLRELDLQPADR